MNIPHRKWAFTHRVKPIAGVIYHMDARPSEPTQRCDVAHNPEEVDRSQIRRLID